MSHFFNCISDKTIFIDESFKNKDDVLKKISESVDGISAMGKVSKKEVFNSLKDREMLGTTGFGGRIAIPHCRLPDIDDFVIGLITSKNGVDFDSLDGLPVNLFVYIIAPEQETNEHIRLLSAISRTLQNKKTVEEIIEAETIESVIHILHEEIHEKLGGAEITKNYKFKICTGNTDIFHEVLELFTSLDASSIYVTEARQAREFLSDIPLYMGFWGDTVENPWQVIEANVEKHLVNDMIRKIQNITGNLNERDDISLTVQELYYSAGSNLK